MSWEEQNDYPAAVQSPSGGGFSRGAKRLLPFALLVLLVGSCVVTALRVLPILEIFRQQKPSPAVHHAPKKRS